MAKKIVDESSLIAHNEYPIRPEQIGTSNHFWNTFGNMETESSAFWIMRFMHAVGKWMPFTEEQIEEFYRANSKFRNFRFNRLTTQGFIVLGDDQKYRVTHEFICLCFKSSPNIALFATEQTA